MNTNSSFLEALVLRVVLNNDLLKLLMGELSHGLQRESDSLLLLYHRLIGR